VTVRVVSFMIWSPVVCSVVWETRRASAGREGVRHDGEGSESARRVCRLYTWTAPAAVGIEPTIYRLQGSCVIHGGPSAASQAAL
jgi:hypothetical protein